MNYQYKKIPEPIKVVVTNALYPASQLLIVKILSGIVFGDDQLIEMNLLVYSNEVKSAQAFKLELESCAFCCTRCIEVSSDLPSATAADVFCLMTDFANPNAFERNKDDEQFNALNLIIKLANNLRWPDRDSKENKVIVNIKNKQNLGDQVKEKNTCQRYPIFMADGLVVIDILKSLSRNTPSNMFFCPSSITPIAKTVLGDYLNVHCKVVNDVFVWAANDNIFHIEVDMPLIRHDDTGESHCDRDVVGKDLMESLNIDTTHFNASWLKKEFVEKVATSASKNPYGCIYRAVEFSRSLRDIWLARTRGKVYNNMGVISDGSLGTITGLPYILPVVFEYRSWSVNKRFEEDVHLKQEINKINEEVKLRHQQLISHCKKFLQENKNHDFTDEDSSYSTVYN